MKRFVCIHMLTKDSQYCCSLPTSQSLTPMSLFQQQMLVSQINNPGIFFSSDLSSSEHKGHIFATGSSVSYDVLVQLHTYSSHPYLHPLRSQLLPPSSFLLVFFHRYIFLNPFWSATANTTCQYSLLESQAAYATLPIIVHSLAGQHLLPSASPASSFLGGNGENSDMQYNTRVCQGTRQRKNKEHKEKKKKREGEKKHLPFLMLSK